MSLIVFFIYYIYIYKISIYISIYIYDVPIDIVVCRQVSGMLLGFVTTALWRPDSGFGRKALDKYIYIYRFLSKPPINTRVFRDLIFFHSS